MFGVRRRPAHDRKAVGSSLRLASHQNQREVIVGTPTADKPIYLSQEEGASSSGRDAAASGVEVLQVSAERPVEITAPQITKEDVAELRLRISSWRSLAMRDVVGHGADYVFWGFFFAAGKRMLFRISLYPGEFL